MEDAGTWWCWFWLLLLVVRYLWRSQVVVGGAVLWSQSLVQNHICSTYSPGNSQFSSVAQSCLTLCDPMNHSTPGLPVHHQLPESTQTHVHRVGVTIQPSHLCRPLLLLPSIFPSIRVFSNESALRVRLPKYWSFSFNTSPSVLPVSPSSYFLITWWEQG